MSFSRLRVRSLHLVLDWDGTLTMKDTMHFLGSIAMRNIDRKRRGELSTQPQGSSVWDQIVKWYMDDYSKHEREYYPPEVDRRTVQQEGEWLASLEGVEDRSARRVEKSGVFSGVRKSDVVDEAKEAVKSGELQLRPGWADLFTALGDRRHAVEAAVDSDTETVQVGFAPITTRQDDISILSVNWSTAWIRACIAEAVNTSLQEPSVLRAVAITANQIEGLDEPKGSSGMMSRDGARGIRTSKDKLSRLPQSEGWAKDIRENGEEYTLASAFTVYVGDSCTDLECLLAADIGICVRDEPLGNGQRELAKTLERCGVQVSRLSEIYGKWEETQDKEELRQLWWTKDFHEVAELIRCIPTS